MNNSQIVELLVQKGIIETGDLATGGKLNPVQADRFIDFVIDETGLKEMSRIVRFRNEELKIDKIGVGKRVTVPAAEAKDPSVRKGVTTSQVILNPSEIMTPFELSQTFMEHNIEGEPVEDRIVRMMATAMGNDAEELLILGDTVGPAILESEFRDGGSTTQYIKDSFLALGDGWLKLASGGDAHQVDIQGASVSPNVFSRMIQAMPTKFRRNPSRLRFILPMDLEQMYRERLSTRATGGGDRALGSAIDSRIAAFGIPIVPVSLLHQRPTIVEHVTFTGSGSTVSLKYTNIQNVVVSTSNLSTNPPETPFILTTDYTVDLVNGTITHAGGGSAIGATAVVKVTYQSSPHIILTHMDNMITAIGRDIQIERDRDIFARLNQWAITTKVDAKYEELDAVVHAFNISSTL